VDGRTNGATDSLLQINKLLSRVVAVRIITVKRLRDAAEQMVDAELANDLSAWMRLAQGVSWKSFNDLRQTFPSADNVDGVVVFNIRRNRYRLLTRVIYSRFSEPDQKWTPGQVLIGAVMTHAEYDRWCKLKVKERKERIWPQR
jgi:mRNA interferase HigB